MENYNKNIENIRDIEYPMLRDIIYLDHGGTAIPSKSLIEEFSSLMTHNLFANPHSTSLASDFTSKQIDFIRLRLLEFFGADPEEYDLIFVSNTTHGIKLIGDIFKDNDEEFLYFYHDDSHTSLIGVRELTKNHECFQFETEFEEFYDNLSSSILKLEENSSKPSSSQPSRLKLFSYPAQSNMNGKKYSLNWVKELKSKKVKSFFTLLDAASLTSTSPLNLKNKDSNPNFIVLSLYKIFGFPDLGVLLIQKSTSNLFNKKKYFGGGTVDIVFNQDPSWYIRKKSSLHEILEDGSLPIHNILCIDPSLNTHLRLFSSMETIMLHCLSLTQKLFDELSKLYHPNNVKVFEFYHDKNTDFKDYNNQGPILTFNMKDMNDTYIPLVEIEKLCNIKNIHIRTGFLCNPGSISKYLNLSSEDLLLLYNNGFRCGNDQLQYQYQYPSQQRNPSEDQKSKQAQKYQFGVCRVSIGPENILSDITYFIDFIKEFFVHTKDMKLKIDDQTNHVQADECNIKQNVEQNNRKQSYLVESITVYPIKSCFGYTIPENQSWKLKKEGLEWDREWCVVLKGSNIILNQKKYPRMVLIRPEIDIQEGLMRISYKDDSLNLSAITIPIFKNPKTISKPVTIFGDNIKILLYDSEEITDFFSKALGISCQLGRFSSSKSTKYQRFLKRFPNDGKDSTPEKSNKDTILLSNESPILLITRSSLDHLNQQVLLNGNSFISHQSFRANIVVSKVHENDENDKNDKNQKDNEHILNENAYEEDNWSLIQIGSERYKILGPCRRCQMICIDQNTGKRNQEPFITLSKTRRVDGKVYFGQHLKHISSVDTSDTSNTSIDTNFDKRVPTISIHQDVSIVE